MVAGTEKVIEPGSFAETREETTIFDKDKDKAEAKTSAPVTIDATDTIEITSTKVMSQKLGSVTEIEKQAEAPSPQQPVVSLETKYADPANAKSGATAKEVAIEKEATLAKEIANTTPIPSPDVAAGGKKKVRPGSPEQLDISVTSTLLASGEDTKEQKRQPSTPKTSPPVTITLKTRQDDSTEKKTSNNNNVGEEEDSFAKFLVECGNERAKLEQEISVHRQAMTSLQTQLVRIQQQISHHAEEMDHRKARIFEVDQRELTKLQERAQLLRGRTSDETHAAMNASPKPTPSPRAAAGSINETRKAPAAAVVAPRRQVQPQPAEQAKAQEAPVLTAPAASVSPWSTFENLLSCT